MPVCMVICSALNLQTSLQTKLQHCKRNGGPHSQKAGNYLSMLRSSAVRDRSVEMLNREPGKLAPFKHGQAWSAERCHLDISSISGTSADANACTWDAAGVPVPPAHEAQHAAFWASATAKSEHKQLGTKVIGHGAGTISTSLPLHHEISAKHPCDDG